MPLKVLIVGAGIAGLSCAAELRQTGHDVEIFEKSAFAKEVGAGLSTTPNCTRILERLGVEFENTFPLLPKSWDVYKGSDLAKLRRVEFGITKDSFGADIYQILRQDLHSELLRLATGNDSGLRGKPARLHLSCGVIAISADSTTITLGNGETRTGDVVIGADGLKSVVRDFILGDDADIQPVHQPVHSGFSAFRFLVDSTILRKDPELSVLLELGPESVNQLIDIANPDSDRNIVWYGCHGGEIQSFTGIHPADNTTTEEGDAVKVAMEQEFRHFDPRIAKLISVSSHVKKWPLFVSQPLRKWVRGHAVVIGDAAHPMLPFGGQGAAMAIEDSCALGLFLKDVETSSKIDSHLHQFENFRRNRASRVQILSSVTAGKEQKVESEIRKYTDSPNFQIPTNHNGRIVHDWGYDLLAEHKTFVNAQVV